MFETSYKSFPLGSLLERKPFVASAWASSGLQSEIFCRMPLPTTTRGPRTRLETQFPLFGLNFLVCTSHCPQYIWCFDIEPDNIWPGFSSQGRSPQLLDLLKEAADLYKWEHGGGDMNFQCQQNITWKVSASCEFEKHMHWMTLALLSAWTMESLAEDYYVPGTQLCSPAVLDDWWRQVKALLSAVLMWF